MRLLKFFMFLFICTSICLLFIYQQFLIIKANYMIKKDENRLSQLLDHHQKLMYNVKKLESPANLERALDVRGIRYGMPRQWAVVKEEKGKSTYELAKVVKRRNVLLERILNFMTMKTEAQTRDK